MSGVNMYHLIYIDIYIRIEVLTMGGAIIFLLFQKWAKNANFCGKVLEKHGKSRHYNCFKPVLTPSYT